MHRGGGGCNTGLGAGGNSGGGGQQGGGGVSQPLRTALHTISISIKSPLKFKVLAETELKGSKST